MSTKVLQIMPADGWRAIYVYEDGNHVDEMLAAWALVEEDYEDTEDGSYRYLAGLAPGEVDGVFSLAAESCGFVLYLPPGEQMTPERVTGILRDKISRAERAKRETSQHFDAIRRQKECAIEILSRNWHDFTEGKTQALRKLRSERDEAARRAGEVRERELERKQGEAYRALEEKAQALAARAESLAAAELTGEKSPVSSPSKSQEPVSFERAALHKARPEEMP
jgi:hypothetical protein